MNPLTTLAVTEESKVVLNTSIEYMKAGRVQSERVVINSHGEFAQQYFNPNAEADYQDYLARRRTHILTEEGTDEDD